MLKSLRRYSSLTLLSLIGAVLCWFMTALPSQAHWADLAAAEIVVHETAAQMTLTFPTGLVSFADENQDNQLSVAEVQQHTAALQTFFAEKIQFIDSQNVRATLAIESLEPTATLPLTVQLAPSTHSTLRFVHTWSHPVQGLRIYYNFFLPNVPTASCLATILQAGQLQTFVFTPKKQWLALTPGLPSTASGGLLLAIAGAFVWGAVHSMSPGHGKTVVGAYLVGSRATPKHALFLALTTTITHTIGVFALGLITLFAAQFILPEQIYPWLSLFSGLMVVAIGLNLLISRLHLNLAFKHRARQPQPLHHHLHHQGQSPHPHAHAHHSHEHHTHEHHSHTHHIHEHHTHTHAHRHDAVHPHSHLHHHHAHDHHHFLSASALASQPHSHLPPGADDTPVTWRSLLTLGISGGLVPCPAALVLLLSAIALNHIQLGLLLVLAFSLGLAGVLTSLGLLLVYAKHLFKRVPVQLRLIKLLPPLSAVGITLIGIGISAKALLQAL